METMYRYLFLSALLLIAAALLMALVRAIKGPRVADRVMGINMIGTLTVAAIAILAVLKRQSWLLDVSIVYALISFVAVVVLSKIMISNSRHGGDDDV